MNHDLIRAARSRIGTPWKHNQKTDGVGYDCLRFWEIIAEEAGIELEGIPTYYGWFGSMEEVLNYCQSRFTEVAIEETKPADLIVLSYNGLPHLGIADWMEEYGVLGIIHCSNKHKRVVRHSMGQSFSKRWRYSFRILQNPIAD